ncbi:MAG: pyridoxamine 5-phosphate oxidase [Burkholderia sp.]|nr:pyridoxamine 5-phosphate oxidase [Burkholderia sp.]
MLFDAICHALHAASSGALATQSARMPGYPYASALPFALDEEHHPIFLISRLAEHTRNLFADPHCSLLVAAATGADVLANARLTLIGDAAQVEPSPALRARYLRYQPEAAQYLALGDFAFFRFVPRRARFVAGFGQMGWLDENEWAGAAVLPLADEAALVDELAGVQPAGVRVPGLDRYGIDVVCDGLRERREFADAPVAVEDLRAVVMRLF